MSGKTGDPILQMYIEESKTLLEELEDIILSSEKDGNLKDRIDEIFRIMHTIKGNSAMMKFDNIASVAHKMEDMFDFLRKNSSLNINFSEITDISLSSMDFIKGEVLKIEIGEETSEDGRELLNKIEQLIKSLSSKDKDSVIKEIKYEAVVRFEKDCLMENIRAFTLLRNMEPFIKDTEYYPKDIAENDSSSEEIQKNGFKIIFKTDKKQEEIVDIIEKTSFIEAVDIKEYIEAKNEVKKDKPGEKNKPSVKSGLNVNTENVDKLMDLVGELVIAESMVTKNPAVANVKSENFDKSARLLKKIINDIQDVVMTMRLVPISPVFKKMNRIVRDMSKNLKKDAELELLGEDTEIDKNLIDPLSDALMHMTRNSMDHGIEENKERIKKGKSEKGHLKLEAKSEGGDVYIVLTDDGAGLNKEKIYDKAIKQGLIQKSIDELTDKDIYSLIFKPGFSTNEKVTEYSGRGVGMDVVIKSIEEMRGKVYIDSKKDQGTKITIKVPLTLAIIDGLLIRVGASVYAIPVKSVAMSFKPKKKDIIKDLEGNLMVMSMGECIKIIKLYEQFETETSVTDIDDGIIVMINYEGNKICLFADSIIGQQQIVMKPLPKYFKKLKGISGCTLLGDGSISLIIDAAGLVQ
ncbi:MAG: chemotaxis protein CheA [Bacillota bacterium]|nr:chemotaxis protein CheA [Bacillota bacterium]